MSVPNGSAKACRAAPADERSNVLSAPAWWKSARRVVATGLCCALPLGVGVGCERGAPTPGAARRIPLPAAAGNPAAMSLAVGEGGRMWIGAPGRLTVVDSAGRTSRARSLPIPEPPIAPRVIRTTRAHAIVRSGDRLISLRGADLRTVAERTQPGVVAPDPRGRHLYLGTAEGAVFGLDPASLEPRWAWAKLGAPTLALAAAPEGDRIVQVLGEAGTTQTRLLTRDVQTGRILHDDTIPARLRDVVAAGGGMLYAVSSAGDGPGEIVALRPGAEKRRRAVWRRPLADIGLSGAAQLRISAAGDRLLVFTPGGAGGARLLNPASGTTLATIAPPVADAAFRSGRVYLLDPGAVRVFR